MFQSKESIKKDEFNIERTMSAPPQSVKNKTGNEENSSQHSLFVLTNRDGSPIKVSTSEMEATNQKETDDVPCKIFSATNDKDKSDSVETNGPMDSNTKNLEVFLDKTSNTLNNLISKTNETLDSIVTKTGDVMELANMNISMADSFKKPIDGFEYSSEEEELSDYTKFVQVETLMKEFPNNVDTAQDGISLQSIKDSINNILLYKPNPNLKMTLLTKKTESNTSKEKIAELKNKVDTSIEKMRHHFNRITVLNQNEVIADIKKVKVQTIAEMKEISNFLFNKICNEPVFLPVYILVVFKLKNDWRCTEELNMKDQVPQTCFFGTLLSLATAKIHSNHDWSTKYDISNIMASNDEERAIIIEQYVYDRDTIRGYVFGSLDFFVQMYIKNYIGYANVKSSLDYLFSKVQAEHIECLCYVYKNLSEKLIAVGKLDELQRINDYLLNNFKKFTMRIKFMVEALNINELKIKSEKSQNVFEGIQCLESSESEEQVKISTPQEFMGHVFSALDLTSDNYDILEFGKKVLEELKKHNTVEFLRFYFEEMCAHHKISKRYMLIFIDIIAKNVNVLESLFVFKEDLKELIIDFPSAKSIYCEVISKLIINGLIETSDFEKLKCDGFFEAFKGIANKINKEDLLKVLSEAEIQSL